MARKMSQSERDLDTLARTIWGEARGETRSGRQAVANVVMNRVADPGWWTREPGFEADTVEAACRMPWQFSCWNQNDPNSAKLAQVDTTNAAFRVCLALAGVAMSGQLPDITGGADHYHVKTMKNPPQWAKGRVPTAIIGRHAFYKIGRRG